MKSILPLPALGALAALMCLSLTPAVQAQASLAACGNVRVEASAECVVETGIECSGSCEDLRFEAACAGKLEVACRGECNASATVDCSGTCQASCEGRCTAQPGSFDCRGECNLEANAHCQGECSAAGNSAECEASCKATFSAQCDARCEGTPPTASCEGKCQASCEGSCRAKANASCQIDCQSDSYVQCKADLKGGCTLDCDTDQGALYCDGQYVDYGNNLKNCLDALKAEVNVTASSRGSCANGRCEGEAEAKVSCGVAQGRPSSIGFFALAAVGLGVALRRRRGQRLQ